MAVLGENRDRNLRFWFCGPQKALPCAEPRRLTYFVSKSVRVSAVAFLKNPKKVAESLFAEGREITHAQNRNHWTDLDKILRDGRYRRRSYVLKFWWPSVKGFLGGGGSNFPISHWLSSSPLQHSRTTLRGCDNFTVVSVWLSGCVRCIYCSIYMSVCLYVWGIYCSVCLSVFVKCIYCSICLSVSMCEMYIL